MTDCTLKIRLTAEQREALETLATHEGHLSVASYVRVLLQREINKAPATKAGTKAGTDAKPDKPKAPGRPPKPRSLTELQLIAVTEEIHNRRDATRRRVGDWSTYKARHLSGPGHLESALREVARYHYEGKMMEYPGLPSEPFDSSYIDDPADRLFIEDEVRRLIAAGT